MNIFFLYILLSLFKNITSNLIKKCLVGNTCDGQLCSTHGNCILNIYKFYNNTSSNTTLNSLSKRTVCQCHKGYLTYYPNSYQLFGNSGDVAENNNYNSSLILCCYKQKLQIIAFILELFFGFGMGHFYLENYYFACGKLFINIVLLFIGGFTLFIFCSNAEDDKNLIYHPSILVFTAIVMVILSLHFIDLVIMGVGYHTDGNGQRIDLW